MIDIHCHLLPGIDDGPKSWEMTREMLRIAADDGITHIVCSPHANEEFAYDRPGYLGLLAQAQEMAGEWPQLLLGCDFHLSVDNILDALAHPRRYTIGSTPYLLIEFSDFGIAPGILESIHRLIAAGMRPIVTHPERNATLLRSPEIVRRLFDLGCFVQITASSITGQWGEQAKASAVHLLQQKLVHAVASDAHDPKHRPPRLSPARAAVAQIVGEEVAKSLVEDNPRAVVEGRPMPYVPEPLLQAKAGAPRAI